MKILASLFFILTAPSVVLFATLLYGGISVISLKDELKNANTYQTISQTLTQGLTETENNEAPDEALISLQPILQERLTDTYLQQKLETFLDDTAAYTKGKSQTPPTLSFKEIKEDIIAQNPQLLTDLQETFTKMQKESMSSEATQQMTQEEKQSFEAFQKADPIGAFVKNDFSLPVGEAAKGLRQAHQTLTILLPVLAILMLLSLLALWILAPTLKSKMRWIGITLLITALGGGILLLIHSGFLTAFQAALLKQEGDFAHAMQPILRSITLLFVTKYIFFQKLMSGSFAALGILLLIGSLMIPATATKPQPLKQTGKKTSKK